MSDPCNYVSRIDALERRDDSIFSAIKKMEDKFDSKLDLILFQISKIAVLEANHQHQSTALDRAFKKIEDLQKSVDVTLEFKNKTEGMAKMAWYLWGGLSGVVGFLLIKVFF